MSNKRTMTHRLWVIGSWKSLKCSFVLNTALFFNLRLTDYDSWNNQMTTYESYNVLNINVPGSWVCFFSVFDKLRSKSLRPFVKICGFEEKWMANWWLIDGQLMAKDKFLAALHFGDIRWLSAFVKNIFSCVFRSRWIEEAHN